MKNVNGYVGGIFGIIAAIAIFLLSIITISSSSEISSALLLVSAVTLLFSFVGIIGSKVAENKASSYLMFLSAVGGIAVAGMWYLPAFLFLLVGGFQSITKKEVE